MTNSTKKPTSHRGAHRTRRTSTKILCPKSQHIRISNGIFLEKFQTFFKKPIKNT